LAYTLVANDDAKGTHYFFSRYDTAGQTNGLKLPYSSSHWSVGLYLIDKNTTQSATNVSVAVCTGTHASCSLNIKAATLSGDVKW
jgi:hypothetical protein